MGRSNNHANETTYLKELAVVDFLDWYLVAGNLWIPQFAIASFVDSFINSLCNRICFWLFFDFDPKNINTFVKAFSLCFVAYAATEWWFPMQYVSVLLLF